MYFEISVLSIAVHNIPQGLAISLALVPRRVGVAKAAFWSVFFSAHSSEREVVGPPASRPLGSPTDEQHSNVLRNRDSWSSHRKIFLETIRRLHFALRALRTGSQADHGSPADIHALKHHTLLPPQAWLMALTLLPGRILKPDTGETKTKLASFDGLELQRQGYPSSLTASKSPVNCA